MNIENLEQKLKLLEPIESLSDKNHDVDTWLEHMENFQDMAKIVNEEEFYRFCAMKIKGTGLKKVKEGIKTDNNGNTIYPSLNNIKMILYVHYNLEVDSLTIIDQIKEMKIPRDGDLMEFNKAFKELHDQLDYSDKFAFTVADYVNSIEYKKEAWEDVQLSGVKKLEEAMEVASRYEKVANKTKLKREANRRQNQGNYNNNNNRNNYNESKPPKQTNATRFRNHTCYHCGLQVILKKIVRNI